MRRATILIAFAVVSLLPFGAVRSVVASDMTEAYQHLEVAFPIVPDPFYCRIMPRPAVDFDVAPGSLLELDGRTGPALGTVRLDAPPAGNPFRAVAADLAVERQVAQTIYLIHACSNAGDGPRLTAVWTDARFAWLTGSPPLREALVDLSAMRPVAVAERISLLGLSEVTVLPDGRVGWLLELELADGRRQQHYGIVKFEGGRYRLEQIAFVAPLPGAGEAHVREQAAPSACDGRGLTGTVPLSTGPGLEPGRRWEIRDPASALDCAPPPLTGAAADLVG